MLDIGWSELLVIAIVAIVVVGPKDLPKLMRTFGFYAGKVRRMAADFQRQFQEAMAESEADEVRKNIEAIRSNMGTTADFGAPLDRPVMTGEPPRTALGAPPLDTQQAEEPARRRAPAKKAAKATKSESATPKNTTAKSATPRKAKSKPAAKKTKTAKTKVEPKS
jgi:sec-independent protein translocase protein TatB